MAIAKWLQVAVALIKMFGFQLGYGYIADYKAEYFITLMQQKSVC